MLYSEIIAVCSQIHTRDINILCGQNVELLNVKLVVRIVTAGLWRVDMNCDTTGTQSSFFYYVLSIAVIMHYMQDSKCIVATCVST
jgi:hypothetical protein